MIAMFDEWNVQSFSMNNGSSSSSGRNGMDSSSHQKRAASCGTYRKLANGSQVDETLFGGTTQTGGGGSSSSTQKLLVSRREYGSLQRKPEVAIISSSQLSTIKVCTYTVVPWDIIEEE